MDYSSDYNNLPDEDLEERDAIGQLAEENVLENQRELEDEIEEESDYNELKKLVNKYPNEADFLVTEWFRKRDEDLIQINRKLLEKESANAISVNPIGEEKRRIAMLDGEFTITKIKDN